MLQQLTLNRAKRVCFLRNSDKSFYGISLMVSKKHYRVLEMLLKALTEKLSRQLVLKSAITRIYRVDGQLIESIDDIHEADTIVCCCANEAFEDVDYSVNQKHAEYLMSIMRMGRTFDGIELTPEEEYLMQFTPDQLPDCIQLYFEVTDNLFRNDGTLIFGARGKFHSDLKYVIKVVGKEQKTTKDEYCEVETLRLLQSHENIMDLVITVEMPKYVFIIVERLDCDLKSLKEMFSEPFEESFVQRIMVDVARGLEYMHSHQIVHRDIKLDNLLVQKTPGSSLEALDIAVIKICDFGLATIYKGCDLHQWCGTPFYMAPELISHGGYDLGVDCWSLGVTLFYLLCNRFPYGNDCEELDDICDSIENDVHVIPPEHAVNLSIEAQHLINSLLDKSRECRISATEIRRHPFLQLKH